MPMLETSDGLATEHARVVAGLIGKEALRLERIGGGRNSRVYRVHGNGGEQVAKFYFGRTADGRSRSQVEFDAFEFLWQHGMRCIPEPLKQDHRQQVALYAYVEGTPVEGADASERDLDQLAAFVRALKALAGAPGSLELPPAAEAFFSVAAVVDNVAERYRRMAGLEGSGDSYDALRQYLRGEFAPALAQFAAWARTRSRDFDAEIPLERRTLSPSDLGFHNSVRTAAGSLVFLDFEYFGWDDPAKALSDALLHPRMDLAQPLRTYLAGRFASVFDEDPQWRARVEALYPLFGLKWCMILLNEFRNDQLERRRFVDQAVEQTHDIQMRQLRASRALLERILDEHPRFPFWREEAR